MSRLADAVGDALGVAVTSSVRLGGGDVADSFRMELADGRTVFAKTHASPPPGFFTTEAAGLRWLAEPEVIAVPTVLAVADGTNSVEGEHVEPPMLVLEWIDTGGPMTPTGEAEFGRSLALLHQHAPDAFGRGDRRTTGSRALPNEPCDTWADFYVTQRLEPLRRLAADALPRTALHRLDRVMARIDLLGGPAEPPARLHGDLWAGNRVVERTGRSWLIDPAAHGGHREFDLAMMRLFGGFGRECFDAYHDVAPLADGWQARVPLHQLAPLVVHSIKFGGSYVGAVGDALDRLVGA